MVFAKKLAQGADLGVAVGAIYTTPANTRTLIKKLTFTNHGAAAVTVTVHLVPSGGAANNQNMIWNAVTVPAPGVAANPTRECFEAENHVLEPGDTLQALASAATVVNAQASGIEMV